MKTNTIITIGRQYGSAGRQIGRVLAEELGIKCYDKELLERAAKESGLCEELFENHDEKPTNSFLYSLVRRKRRRNERTAANIITNMLRKGKSPEEIADMTGEDLEEIQEIQKQLL